MIGIPFQQVANQYGLNTSQGVAYGTIQGYPVTFLDGAGCHRIMVTTRFATPSQKDNLMDIINAQDLKGLYNIRKLQIAKKVIHIVFKGVPSTMDKVPAFVEWFFPLLEENGASKQDVCIQCQEPLDDADAQWVLRDGAVAFRMHKSCAEELKESVAAINAKTATPDGSIGKGILGAAIGALIGSLLWLVMQYINFFGPVASIFAGWLAVYMYGKLGGKKCAARLPVVVVVTALSVVFGIILAEIPGLVELGAGWNVLHIFFQTMRENYAFMTGIWSNFSMGLIFGGMGIYLSIKNDARKTDTFIVTNLE